MSPPEQHKSIKTFAILDVEINDYHQHQFNQCSLTEFCLYAISAKCLDNDIKNNGRETKKAPKLPRVVNKLKLMINPMRRIHDNTKTGLDNYMLENESPFNENTSDCILSFINHLEAPVCLVAHYGKHHDFPIIRHVYEKLNQKLPASILWVDSLEAFRKIDTVIKMFEKMKEKNRKYTKTAKNSNLVEDSTPVTAIDVNDNFTEILENTKKNFQGNILMNDVCGNIFSSQQMINEHTQVKRHSEPMANEVSEANKYTAVLKGFLNMDKFFDDDNFKESNSDNKNNSEILENTNEIHQEDAFLRIEGSRISLTWQKSDVITPKEKLGKILMNIRSNTNPTTKWGNKEAVKPQPPILEEFKNMKSALEVFADVSNRFKESSTITSTTSLENSSVQENILKHLEDSSNSNSSSSCSWQKINETTPQKKRIFQPSNVSEPVLQDRLKEKRAKFIPENLKVKRQLEFNDNKRYGYSYKLGKLYQNLFKEEDCFNLHEAETDVKILTQLILHYGKEFLDYANNNKMSFDEVQRLGAQK